MPCSYDQREKLKKVDYDRISEFGNKFSRDERLEGAQMLLEAYYDKSLSGALSGEYWKEHPKFEEYIALVNHEKVFPKDISNYLREKYGTSPSSQKNYWFPA